MPMVYTQFFIGSEIFDLLRSSQYTPSVSPCGLPAPSEREPGLAVPFIQPPGNRNVAGDFHRPYGTQMWVHFSIQRTTLPQSALAGCQLPQRGSREGRVPFNRAGGQRRDWKVAIWVVASSRALSQKALSVRSIPATRAVASAVATVVVCSSFLYTGTKSGPCWRYLA